MGYSYQAQLGIGASEPVTNPLAFESEDLRLREEFIYAAGITGVRSQHSERTRRGIGRVSGTITMHPTKAELASMLTWILGGTAVGSTYPLADTLPERYVTIDRVEKVYTYDGVKVSAATFSATQNGPLNLTLELVGVDETVGNSGSFPALNVDLDEYFVFSDLVMSVGGTTVSWRDFNLRIDNFIDAERFLNNTRLQTAYATDRVVTWSMNTPYLGATALYGLALAGVQVTATFTSTADALVFSSSKTQFPKLSPAVPGKPSEIDLPLVGVARKDGSTLELVTTLT